MRVHPTRGQETLRGSGFQDRPQFLEVQRQISRVRLVVRLDVQRAAAEHFVEEVNVLPHGLGRVFRLAEEPLELDPRRVRHRQCAKPLGMEQLRDLRKRDGRRAMKIPVRRRDRVRKWQKKRLEARVLRRDPDHQKMHVALFPKLELVDPADPDRDFRPQNYPQIPKPLRLGMNELDRLGAPLDPIVVHDPDRERRERNQRV